MNIRALTGALGLIATILPLKGRAASAPVAESVDLDKGWAIQTSAVVTAKGEAISQPGFAATGWYPATVPSTVLGTLVDAGVYKDPFFGKNMASIPTDPFKVSWWYRTEFTARGGATASRLIFDGVSFRANVWLNGQKIADKGTMFGVWRVFDVDVTRVLRDGANALAVEVFPSVPGEFSIGFVDWNPLPADRNMGLYRGVSLRRSGPVSIEDPVVRSHVDLKTLKSATLAIEATLVNHGDTAVTGKLKGEVAKNKFAVSYALGPKEKKTIHITPAEASALRIHNPRLWWPSTVGSPELYTLVLRAWDPESDTRQVTFGIREVGDYLNESGHRGYTVNGKPIQIRGGGWVDDVFLREDPAKLEAQLDYVRHMNLNTIRLEGFWGSSQKLYEIADRKGVLVMTGFSCQWEWDHYLGKPQDNKTYGAAQSPAEIDLLAAYLHDQVLWLRNHPSVLVWVLGSDKLPYPEAEKRYRAILKDLDPGRPYLASAKGWQSEVSGPTAVKMLGPYNYVTPNYWYEDRTHGGAYGFNTETGPGPQVPPLASLKKMIPADKLWPLNDVWNFHCAEHEYNDLSLFSNAFDHRYGPVKSAAEFAFKSQAASYEAMRAMFGAFAANRPSATGIIQWMLNSAWPRLYWQLYDYWLMPTGAFYGARKAAAPQNLLYNYADRGVYIVNDKFEPIHQGMAEVTLLDVSSRPVWAEKLKVTAGSNTSAKVLDLPPLDPRSQTYFLDLKLHGANDQVVAQNFYWLSPKPDVLDWEKSTEPFVPNKSFADFTALSAMAPVKVKVASKLGADKGQVTLTNSSDRVAFFIELQLERGAHEPIVPVLWDDNYVSLLPGETRTINVSYAGAGLKGVKPTLAVQGWNVTASL